MGGTVSNKRHGAVGDKLAPSSASANARQDGHEGPIAAPASVRQPHESRINRIARRAHEIYEARGGEHGKAMEDWLLAEREVDAEMDAQRSGEDETKARSPWSGG